MGKHVLAWIMHCALLKNSSEITEDLMCICDQYILGKIKVFCLLLANVLSCRLCVGLSSQHL